MDADEKLAKWAALFVRTCSNGDTGAGLSGRAEQVANVRYAGVTPAASDLLQAVDAGGVPAFVTASLRQVAEENGIEIPVEWTPNQVVDAIRNKARDHDSGRSLGSGDPATPSGQ